jgi:hypothetical protein
VIEMFRFKKENIMVRDMVRGMMEQGIADEDVLEIMGRAGVPSEMAASLNAVKKRLEDTSSSIKGFEIYAREILKALKKSQP